LSLVKVRQKPAEFSALQFGGVKQSCLEDVKSFVGERNMYVFKPMHEQSHIIVQTREGAESVRRGDWILKDRDGWFSVCKELHFDQLYEVVKRGRHE